MVFSYAQLEGLWENAGGSASAAPVAAAVGEAESSGRSTATSSNPDGGTNVGIWQEDTPGGKGAGYTVAQLENAATNAKVAVQGSSDGSDWSAWATFVSGAYQQFLQPNTPADTNVASPAGGPASTSPTSASLTGFNPLEPWTWGSAGSTVLRYGAEAAGVLAGLGLIVWGIGRFTGAGRKASTAIQTVAQAAPAAAVAA